MPSLAAAVDHVVELFAIRAVENAGKVFYSKRTRV
jgi:hypothetical protein